MLHATRLSCWGHALLSLAAALTVLLLVIIVARVVGLGDVVLELLISHLVTALIALNNFWLVVSPLLVQLLRVVLSIVDLSNVVGGLVVTQTGV